MATEVQDRPVKAKKIPLDDWVKTVKAIDTSGLKGEEKSLYEKVTKVKNIPQKKSKFVNFCIHNMKYKDEKVIQRLFGALAQARTAVLKPKVDKVVKKEKLDAIHGNAKKAAVQKLNVAGDSPTTTKPAKKANQDQPAAVNNQAAKNKKKDGKSPKKLEIKGAQKTTPPKEQAQNKPVSEKIVKNKQKQQQLKQQQLQQQQQKKNKNQAVVANGTAKKKGKLPDEDSATKKKVRFEPGESQQGKKNTKVQQEAQKNVQLGKQQKNKAINALIKVAQEASKRPAHKATPLKQAPNKKMMGNKKNLIGIKQKKDSDESEDEDDDDSDDDLLFDDSDDSDDLEDEDVDEEDDDDDEDDEDDDDDDDE